MMNIRYRDAFEEVYVVLNYLDENDYSKIPKRKIEVIEKNRNREHNFDIDLDISLKEQNLMAESKAILFNLFRDYYATSEKKEKILKIWKEESLKEDEKKRELYDVDVFAQINKKEVREEVKEENLELVKSKENIFKKILNSIKAFFIIIKKH